MANSTQNGAPVFVTPTPIVNPGAYNTSADSVYPQTYMYISPQQQQPPVSFNYKVLLGKTSVIWLGGALLICGALSQIGAAVAFRFFAGLSEVGVGVWCGFMFMAAGTVAIVAAHHGTKKLMNGTAISSGLAVAAAFIQLSVAAAGISKDDDFYDHYYNGDYNGAVAANSIMVFAACMALIGGAWLLLIAVMAVCKEQTSFQDASKPYQFTPSTAQSNIYEDIRNDQMHSTSVQHANQQQQQQLMPVNYPHPISIHPPMSSQVVQMPAAYIPPQTSTTSTIPNQQMHFTPVQHVNQQQQQLMPLNYPNTITIQPPMSSQMLSVPIQYVLPQQQLISMNHPPTNTIDPATFAQVHGQHEAPKNDDRDAEKF